jgi:four helix bundle protein
MKNENVVLDKSFAFAVRIVNAHKHLSVKTNEFTLLRMLLTSGTGIAARCEDAVSSLSTSDFLSSMTLAYKDARRTRFWIRLLTATEHMETAHAESLLADVEELLRIIGSIQKTTRKSFDQ